MKDDISMIEEDGLLKEGRGIAMTGNPDANGEFGFEKYFGHLLQTFSF